jgi:hypothetical protein
MSRAEKCLSTTPRVGRTSLVSSCTRSPRPSNGPKMGLSPGPGTAAHLAATSRHLPNGGFHQHAATSQLAQDPAHHGCGKPDVFATQGPTLGPLGQPEKTMGHESQIELWSPNLTTFCFVGFGTDRLRRAEAMKTAGRENPNHRGRIAPQPSTWRVRSEQISLDPVG